jgi:hypothetical protein
MIPRCVFGFDNQILYSINFATVCKKAKRDQYSNQQPAGGNTAIQLQNSSETRPPRRHEDGLNEEAMLLFLLSTDSLKGMHAKKLLPSSNDIPSPQR